MMTIFNFLISFVPIFLLGASFTLWFFPKKLSLNLGFLLIFFGVLSGFILTSFFTFLYFLIFNQSPGEAYKIFELAAGSFLLFVVFKKYKFSFDFKFLNISLLQKVLLLVFVYFCFQFVLNLIYLALYQPYGGGDAFSIWNLKARFLCRDDGLFWKNIFNQNIFWSHPDYPLFLPASICRMWIYLGEDTVFAPMIISVIFPLLALFILFFGLLAITNFKKSLGAGILLISTPIFLTWGTSQYADIPLSVYMLTSVICFLISKKDMKNNGKLLFLGMFFAASCIWVKSEGMFFFMIYILGIFVFSRKNIVGSIGMSLPILVLYVIFRGLANFNDKFLKQNAQEILFKLLSLERHSIVIKAFAVNIFSLGEWFMNPWIYIILLFVIFRANNPFRKSKEALFLLFILISIFITYYFFYIVTPRGLLWHIDTSLSRLMVQLWPLGILCGALLLNIKEKNE